MTADDSSTFLLLWLLSTLTFHYWLRTLNCLLILFRTFAIVDDSFRFILCLLLTCLYWLHLSAKLDLGPHSRRRKGCGVAPQMKCWMTPGLARGFARESWVNFLGASIYRALPCFLFLFQHVLAQVHRKYTLTSTVTVWVRVTLDIDFKRPWEHLKSSEVWFLLL